MVRKLLGYRKFKFFKKIYLDGQGSRRTADYILGAEFNEGIEVN